MNSMKFIFLRKNNQPARQIGFLIWVQTWIQTTYTRPAFLGSSLELYSINSQSLA